MEPLKSPHFYKTRGYFYNGRSMHSTFRHGDYIHAAPCDVQELRSGDIVVFRTHESHRHQNFFVHRIISIKGGSIITRGDYNLTEDSDMLAGDRLIGKALFFERNGRSFKVINGFWGLLRSKWIRLKLLGKRGLTFLARPLYMALKQSRLVPYFWKPRLKAIILESSSGRKIKYTHRGRTVLVRDGNAVTYKRRPYDLLF